MNRVTRMGVGLVALIPVLLLSGWLYSAVVADGEGVGWLVLATALVWVVLVAWWALRGPAQVSDEARPRYWAALRHSEYQGFDHDDSDARTS